MKNIGISLLMALALLIACAGLALGQSEVSKDPVTSSTDIYFWKSGYDSGSTMITVYTNTSDGEATHFLISVSWTAGSETGSQTKLVKRLPYGPGYAYVMVNAKSDRVVIPFVTATPVKVQPMSTARYSMSGKEYVEP